MTKQQKIEDLMNLGKCDRETAIAYLEADDWISVLALETLKLDRKGGLI